VVDGILPDKKATKTDDADEGTDTRRGKHRIELSFERGETGTSHRKSSPADGHGQSESSSRAQAQAQFAARLNQVLGAIGNGLSSGTAIDVPGPGGEAYADYSQWVMTVYYQAWSPPKVGNDSVKVTAEVIILRNGKVYSFKVTRPSGHGALDKSVELLRNTVTTIAPFPEGTTDNERKFIIEFIPQSKQ
jgi:hypothetical protein